MVIIYLFTLMYCVDLVLQFIFTMRTQAFVQFERSIGNGIGGGTVVVSVADLKQCRAILKRGVSLLSTAAASMQQQQQQQQLHASASAASLSAFSASASVTESSADCDEEGDSQLSRLCRAWVELERQAGDAASLAEANQRYAVLRENILC